MSKIIRLTETALRTLIRNEVLKLNDNVINESKSSDIRNAVTKAHNDPGSAKFVEEFIEMCYDYELDPSTFEDGINAARFAYSEKDATTFVKDRSGNWDESKTSSLEQTQSNIDKGIKIALDELEQLIAQLKQVSNIKSDDLVTFGISTYQHQDGKKSLHKKKNRSLMFSDVLSFAYDAKLNNSVSDLHQMLLTKIKDVDQARRWLKELVNFILKNEIDIYDSKHGRPIDTSFKR